MTLRRLRGNGHLCRDKAGLPPPSRGRSPGSSAVTETARLSSEQKDARRRQPRPPTSQGLQRRDQRREGGRLASCKRCRRYRIALRGGAARGYPASTIPRRTRTRRFIPAPLSRCMRLFILRRVRGAPGARGFALARGTRVGSWARTVPRLVGILLVPRASNM